MEAELDHEEECKVDEHEWVNHFGYAIPSIFVFFLLCLLVLYIVGFIDESLKQYLIWCMIFILFIGSALGMFGMFKYGVIGDHVDEMKCANDDYQNELRKLTKENEKMKQQVKNLKTTVFELEHDAEKLAQQSEKFKGLVDELKEIHCDGVDIGNILDETNKIFADMKKIVLENERAHLLTAFYECAFRKDDDNRMDKREYKRFKLRLTKKQRDRFDQIGSFEQIADESGHIDVEKFQDVLEIVLQDVDRLLREEFEQSIQK